MATLKVAITLQQETLQELDALVKKGVFENRSSAIQQTLSERLRLLNFEQFEKECLKLEKKEERALANEKMKADTEWPEY